MNESATNAMVFPRAGGYPGGLMTLLASTAALGAAVFVWTALEAPQQAWRIYLVNFLICSGVASGAVALAAIFEVSSARWIRVIRYSGEAFAAALPALAVLFLITYFGRNVLMPWAAAGSGVHKPWLDVGSVYLRGALGWLLLAGIGLAFARKSERHGFGAARGLAMAYLLTYVVVNAIQGIDLLMALDPHWVSSLFGGYIFTGNLYMGIAGTMVLHICGLRWLNTGKRTSLAFQQKARSSMGMMLFSFSLIWMYMVWSQWLVIWYGNLPHETRYVQLRLGTQPWGTLSYTVLALNFVLPFLLLLPKASKQSNRLLMAVSLMILAGTWLERFILAIPELLTPGEAVFGVRAALISAGFLAGFLLMVLTSFRRLPILEVNNASASRTPS